jgi:segregation and condensation protein B
MTNQKEKEEAQKLKALRKELEEKIEEQLPAEMLSNDHIRVEVQQVNDDDVLDPVRAKQVIEALLFASSKPLAVAEIRKVVKSLTPGQIAGVLSELRAEYVRDGRSFELLEIANGYEIATRKEFAPWLMKMELQRKIKQVTQSALETLSILAYKQPVTRAEIEELRGVDVSAVLNTLVERNFIRIVGKKEVPGRPFLYGTTEKFLEHFGLKSIQDLPSIDEIRSLVENSVKKEELLGTQNIVEIPAEEVAAPAEANAETAGAVSASAEEGKAQGADPETAGPVQLTEEGSPS